MPVLHAVAHHVAGAAGDLAELALVDQVARQLVRAAEEGVGRASRRAGPCLGALLESSPSSTDSTNGFSE